MLTTRYKRAFNRCFEPSARVLLRLGLGPTAVTLSGLTLIAIGCALVLVTKRIIAFCAWIAVVGLIDALDGAVARAGGRVTAFGAYLDAMCDRYVEALVVLTGAVLSGYWVLSGSVLVGAMLVSYAKARAAIEVPVSNLEWPDLMERAERGYCYVAGLLASQLVPFRPLGHDLFWWTLLVLSVLVHATVIQRMLRARKFIQSRAAKPACNKIPITKSQ
ncbi:MAG: CDP-alcohol phosphatidyltransferase family protein [Candidatus Omnitrophica bacterium]|nr:CDP-alcohol phosphatidyltransferase family protein [Candidatus Omnitrophota bacterium]